jgi:hypothetical protein
MWTAAGNKKDRPMAGNEASCLLGGNGVSAFAEGRRVKSAHYYRILASSTLPVIMYLFKQAAGDHMDSTRHGQHRDLENHKNWTESEPSNRKPPNQPSILSDLW